MSSEVQKLALDRAFRIALQDSTNAIFEVIQAYQPVDGERPAADVWQRAQSLVLAVQEALTADHPVPLLLEQIGAVLYGITDGSDDALFAILSELEVSMDAQIPASFVAEMRRPIVAASKRLMAGWLERSMTVSDPHLRAASERVPSDPGNAVVGAALEQAPAGTLIFSFPRWDLVFASQGHERLFGYTFEEELNLPPERLQNEDSADDDFDLLADMLAGRIPFVERISARPHKDGRSIRFRMLGWPVRDDAGTITHIVEQRFALDRMDAGTAGSGLAEKRTRYLQQISPDPVVIADADGTMLYASPSVESAFGHDPDALIGRHIGTLVTEGSLSAGQSMLERVLQTPRARVVTELEARMSDNTSRWFEVIAANLLDIEDVRGVVFQGRDITLRRELSDSLARAASSDSLTGLLNRSAFLDQMQSWIEDHSRDADASEIGSSVACYIDLDSFKSINDRFGHAAGDAVLVAVSRRLTKLVAGRGFAGRMGGDEFVLVAELASQAERVQFERDLDASLHGTIQHEEHEISFEGSSGIIDLLSTAGANISSIAILRSADEGLIRAKGVRGRISGVR